MCEILKYKDILSSFTLQPHFVQLNASLPFQWTERVFLLIGVSAQKITNLPHSASVTNLMIFLVPPILSPPRRISSSGFLECFPYSVLFLVMVTILQQYLGQPSLSTLQFVQIIERCYSKVSPQTNSTYHLGAYQKLRISSPTSDLLNYILTRLVGVTHLDIQVLCQQNFFFSSVKISLKVFSYYFAECEHCYIFLVISSYSREMYC